MLEAVRRAEQAVVAKPDHEYLPITGIPEFNALSAQLAFGDSSAVVRERRNATVQALSGTGSLRVGPIAAMLLAVHIFCEYPLLQGASAHACVFLPCRELHDPHCRAQLWSACLRVGGRRVPGAALPGEDGAAAVAHLAVAQQDLPAGRRDRRARLPLLQTIHARPGL